MNTYREDLLADLRDPQYAAEYLTVAKKESRKTFLLALRDVAEAQKGIKGVAVAAGVNRENLYRMLSEGGNPRLSSLDSVLDTLGIRLEFVSTKPQAPTSQPPTQTKVLGKIGEAQPNENPSVASYIQATGDVAFHLAPNHTSAHDSFLIRGARRANPAGVPGATGINPIEGRDIAWQNKTLPHKKPMSISGLTNIWPHTPTAYDLNPASGT